MAVVHSHDSLNYQMFNFVKKSIVAAWMGQSVGKSKYTVSRVWGWI